MTLTVELRRGGARVGAVTDWTALRWLEEANTVTGGTITVPADSELIEFARLAPESVDPVGVLITDDVTGHAVPAHFAEQVDSSAAEISLPFVLDVGLLNEVPAFPDPATPGDPWAVNPFWVGTGPAATITADFIASHGGPGSHPDYQIFDQVVAAGAGTPVSYRARMQPSLDVIRDTVAGAAVLQASIDDGMMVLTVRAPTVRPDVVFSPGLHTLLDWEIRDRMPSANDGFGGGPGEGTSREAVRVSLPSGRWPRRRGVFVDRESLTGQDLLGAVTAALSHDGPTMVATAQDNASLSYGTDYQLGDTVKAQVAGREFLLPVTSVETSVAAGGGPVRTVQLGEASVEARPDLQLRRTLFRRFGFEETQ